MAVVLAAGLGRRLERVSGGLPKCLVPVGGVPILDRMMDRIGDAGIAEVVVVTGYRAAAVESHLAASPREIARRARCVFNPHYADWGNFYSLLVARDAVGDRRFIKLDADVVMDGRLLPALLAAPGPGALAVDCRAGLGAEEMKVRVGSDGRVVELNKRMDPAVALGESVGIDRIDAELAPAAWAKLGRLIDRGETHEYYERAYELLMSDGVSFAVADVSAVTWCEIDDPDDLTAAETLLSEM